MAPEATKIRGSLAVDTATTRHLVLDARRAVDGLLQVRDTVSPAWIGDAGQRWLHVAVRSANVTWRLLAASIRRGDPTRFLARVDLLCGLRTLLDEAPDEIRAESRLVFAALDDTEVTVRVLRDSLSIRGRHPNPAAAARIRQVLAVIAADLDAADREHQAAGPGAGKTSAAVPAAVRVAEPPSDHTGARIGEPSRCSARPDPHDPAGEIALDAAVAADGEIGWPDTWTTEPAGQ